MKSKFLKKAVAFVTAFTMSLGMVTVMPEGVLPQIGIVASAETSNFTDMPAGDFAYATLKNGVLTISGMGNMWNYPIDVDMSYPNYYGYVSSGAAEPGVYRRAVTSIKIGNNITSIGDYAFTGMENVTSINLSEGITYIGTGSFDSCSGLNSINIPNTVKEIWSNAFISCTSLTSVTIPKTVELIGTDAFAACNSEFVIYCYKDSEAERYAKEENINYVLLDAETPDTETYTVTYIGENDEVIYTKTLNVGETAIYDSETYGVPVSSKGYKFLGWGINKDDTIPNTETYKGEYGDRIYYALFENNTIASGKCGDNAYWKITNDGTLTISGTGRTYAYDTYIDFGNGDFTKAPWYTYSKNVKNIVVENGITYLGKNSFRHMRYVKSATIADSVTSMGDNILGGCSLLETVKIPKNLKVIPGGMFSATSLKEIDIPLNVTTIGGDAFSWCKNLTEIILPEKVTTIDQFAFTNCDKLVRVAIPKSVNNISTRGIGAFGHHNTELTFYGYSGSYAETWAKDNNIKFVAVDKTLTDAQRKEMQDYINEHFFSAQNKYWQRYHEVQDTMKEYDENDLLEGAHSAVIVLDTANEIVNPSITGIGEKISANAYNAILLDMYYNIEYGDKSDDILTHKISQKTTDKIHDAVKPYLALLSKSSKSGKNYLEIVQGEDLYTFENDIYKYMSGDSTKTWDEIILDFCGDDLDFEKLNSVDINEVEDFCNKNSGAGEFFTQLDNITTGVNTAFDVYENYTQIIEAQVLREMDDEYREVLEEIQNKLWSYNVSGFIEDADLKTDLYTALEYEINYHKYYWAHDIWNTLEAGSSVVFEYLKCDKPGFKAPTDKLNDIIEKPLQKQVDKIFGAGTFAAIGFGYSTGWTLSDQMFTLNESTGLYYEGKAYGFLETILIDVLNEKSNALTYFKSDVVYSDDEIKDMHRNAVLYDIAFKMYRFVESDGCKTYADYNKSFITASKDEGLFKAFMETLGDEVELGIRVLFNTDASAVNIFYDLITGKEINPERLNPLYKPLKDMEEIYLRRNSNVLYYQKRSEFIKNLKCHGVEFESAESALVYFNDIYQKWNEMRKSDFDIVVVMCPVEVNVYDENEALQGTISAEKNTITNNTSIIAYRDELNDANIIVYPSDYKIEIVGLDDGEMNIIGGHYSNMIVDRIVNYIGVPVNDDYIGQIVINNDDDRLINNNSTLNIIKINDIELSEFDKDTTTYNYSLDEGTTAIPTVTATPSNANANVSITQATSLTGTEAERTATITVTAEDGVSQTVYTVTFSLENHIHTLEANYSSDESGHWKKCAGCTDKVDFAMHNYDGGVITTEPTETTEGVKTYTCDTCGFTKTEPVAKFDHTHAPSAEYSKDETGHWKTCSGCDEKLEFAVHNYDDGIVTTEPTETTEGVKTYTCDTCGFTKTEPVAKLDHTHAPSAEYSKDETGHWKTCSGCDEKLEFAVHNYDDGIVTTEPTETAEGVKTYTCDTCGFTKTEPVAKLDHTHAPSAEYSKDETGHWKTCSGCDEKLGFAVHNYDDGIVTTAPTETTEGVKTYICEICGFTKTESISEKSDVSYHISDNGIVTIEPTSYSSGVRTYSCVVCGYVIRTEMIPAVFDYEIYTMIGRIFKEKLNVEAETNGNCVTLSWNKINNADSYYVYQYKNGKYVKVLMTNDTSATFENLSNGKTYKFLAKYSVKKKVSPSTYSGKASATVYYKPIVKAESTKNSVILEWKAVSNAEKYAIYKYSDGKASKLCETKKYVVKIGGLKSDTEYKYIVRAYINGKWTTMTKSDIVTATTK